MSDSTRGPQYLPGINFLDYPTVMEVIPESGVLDLPSVADSGVIVRVPVYLGMAINDTVQLFWKGGDEASTYFAKLSVRDTGRFLDFVVPKSILLADPGSPAGDPLARAHVNYEVFPASGGPKMQSAVTSLLFVIGWSSTPSNPPPEVPDASAGQLDPDKIAAPGLTVLFPRPVLLHARWTSYGRDGRVIYMERFGVEGDPSVVIFRDVLNLTENGGEVRITYYTKSDRVHLVNSLPAVLQVVRH